MPVLVRSSVKSFAAGLALAAGLATMSSAPNAQAMIAIEEPEGGGGGGGGYYEPAPSGPTMCVWGETCTSRPGGTGLVTVYLHGRNTSNGGDNGASYWLNNGSQTISQSDLGPNPVVVRWRGADALASSTYSVATALDRLCGGGLPCQIVCHSTGCLLIGRLVAENNNPTYQRWNITTTYALAGAQGGTRGADIMVAINNGAASWGSRIGSHFGGVWGGVIGYFCGYLLNAAMEHFAGPVTGVVYDLRVNSARSMYNHEVSGSTQTVTASNRYFKKKCRWYQLGCHLNNAGRGLANGFTRVIFGSGADGVLPVTSTASFRYQINQISTCPSYGGTWSNHYSNQQCGEGLRIESFSVSSKAHMEVKGLTKEAKIYWPTTYSEYDDCSESNTEGTCNSYDDYLDQPVAGGDGAPLNARCGGYELGTNNYYYGSDCNALRYSGSTAESGGGATASTTDGAGDETAIAAY
jgi:hypothetical protein